MLYRGLLFGLLVLISPYICMGQSASVSRLIHEKQRKMAELEKCMGTTKGLQIAGVSTLGLTAVGVAGNIAEAKIIKKNAANIEANDTAIDKVQKEIETKNTQLEKKEEAKRVAAEKEAAAALLAECKELLRADNANVDKIATVEKNGNDCKITSCTDNYFVSDDHKSCSKCKLDVAGKLAKGLGSSSTCIEEQGTTENQNADCAGLREGEWFVEFDYGKIQGEGLCSITEGEFFEKGTPDTGQSGKYCWCKATQAKNISFIADWVYTGIYNNEEDCKKDCAYLCAMRISGFPASREALFDCED